MKKILFTLLFVCAAIVCAAQTTTKKNILFIGNSYTEVNDLPNVLSNVAASVNIEMTSERNTPGGCTFMQHCNNQSMTLIKQGGWDIVVLQEQSQNPSFPDYQVQAEVFPFAKRLVDSIYKYNDCAIPMFYMTWGRKYGDAGNAAEFPPLGTYEGMDSLLYERYMYMKETNNAAVSPVGRVWRYLRNNHPNIELYQGDNSHPTLAGTYAAACSFLAAIWSIDPTLVTYVPYAIDPTEAAQIRAAAKAVVYDNLPQWQRHPAEATFTYEVTDNIVNCHAPATVGITYEWDFGDGNTATGNDVSNKYANTGAYVITCTAKNHCERDVTSQSVTVSTISALEMANADIVVAASANILTVVSSEVINTVKVYNATGIELAAYPMETTETSITLPNLPTGLYLVRLTMATGNNVLKYIYIK